MKNEVLDQINPYSTGYFFSSTISKTVLTDNDRIRCIHVIGTYLKILRSNSYFVEPCPFQLNFNILYSYL